MERIPGVGSTLGQYRLTELLGHGGMGVVYRAEDLRLERNVALKLLSGDVSDDARFRTRFLRESRLAASTEHPGIVPIYDAGEVDGLLYIAMRYVEGSDLAGVLRQEGALDPERAVDLVAQLADALDAAHARGLVHRDVKPSNSLISRNGAQERVYLVDFGITEDIQSAERLTETNRLVGTGAYLAPERIRGARVDGRADVYSLGCVLFECLTGEVPFPRSSEFAELYAHLEDEPPRVSDRRPGLPAGLDAVVGRALAKDPEDRWQKCAELAEAARAALPSSTSHVPAQERVAPTRGPQRRAVVGAFVLVVIAAAVVAFAVLSGSGQDDTVASLDENTVGRIDPSGAKITKQVPVGDGPHALAVGAGSVWAANSGDGTVTRIDREGGQIVIPVGDDTSGMAFGEGSLWVTDRQDETLYQISPKTNRVVDSIPVGNGPAAVAVAAGAVWIASDVHRSLKKIDIASGSSREIPLGSNPTAIAAGGGAVWVASEEGGTVFRVEPRTRVVANPVTVGGGPVSLAVGEGAVWVANRQDATVSRIDPATNAVDPIAVGKGPTAVAVGEGAVWVANGGEGTVSRIDPATRRPTATVALKSSPTALAVADGSIWTAVIGGAAGHHGGTLRVETRPYDFKLEPSAYDSHADQVMSLVYSGLVSYRRAGGASYGSLVGDLATEVPKPSPDGRTYVFRLRKGIRYSNGALVKPQDFRVSMETLLRRHGKNLPPFYNQIVGVPACVARPKSCDLSKGIVTDPATGTITLHLTEPDPELMHALASMLAYVAPAEHPFDGKEQPPGTGPYKIVSFNRKRGARLVRNPRFRVWSPDARPDGAADEIVVRVRRDTRLGAQVRAVERGQADVATASEIWGNGIGPAKVRALATRSAGRVYTDAAPLLEYMWLNVREPPLDDVRVRRALNYAVDRDRIEEIAGGANLAQATCQLVPTGFPAYKPSCPYTARPGTGGEWNGPDLAHARRLIERSGTKGMKVTVWTYESKRAYGAYFVSLLQSLGYRSTLRVAADYGSHVRATFGQRRNHAQIGINAWLADFAVPSNFARPFTCEGAGTTTDARLTHYCDRAIDAQFAAARRATGTESNALWQKVYERIEAAAPAVPLVNRREVTLVSKRVGNFQHHPMWGTLLDQLWVR
jgi:peptide/nickel transport system substrate-binding protein